MHDTAGAEDSGAGNTRRAFVREKAPFRPDRRLESREPGLKSAIGESGSHIPHETTSRDRPFPVQRLSHIVGDRPRSGGA